MKRKHAAPLALLAAVVGCADVSAPETPVRIRGFVVADGTPSPGYNDPYWLTAGADGLCHVKRESKPAYMPTGPVTLTITEVHRVPGGWSGADAVPFKRTLSLAETDVLFSPKGTHLASNFVYHIAGTFLHMPTGDIVIGWDDLNCLSHES